MRVDESVAGRLRHVYWIGGGSGAGKSTIARRIAAQHGFRVYSTDEAMLETFHWFRGEGFGLIVEDLLRLPTDAGVIAEGFRLLPRLVKPLLAEPAHAVWLLPTPEFRRAVFDGRGWEIPRKTSDPELARHNLLESGSGPHLCRRPRR